MNLDQIEGQWKRWSGTAMLHWEKIMNDEMSTVAGSYKDLVGKGQKKIGIAKKEAQQQVDELKKIVEQLKNSNTSVMGFQKSLSKKSRSQTHDR
jgi:uncharacterized protein YjbJ (UPF0337 family)